MRVYAVTGAASGIGAAVANKSGYIETNMTKEGLTIRFTAHPSLHLEAVFRSVEQGVQRIR